MEALREKGLVTGHLEGVGDFMFLRPAIRKLSEKYEELYLHTPYPYLFWDLPKIKPVRPKQIMTDVSRQLADGADQRLFHQLPDYEIPTYTTFSYFDDMKKGLSAYESYAQQLGVGDPLSFSMSFNPSWLSRRVQDLSGVIAVVHPPKIRAQWVNTARNPLMEYYQTIIDATPWFRWVSVGCLKDGYEWLDGPPLRGVSYSFDRGELGMTEVLGLLSTAYLVLTAPVFPYGIAAALGTPVFTLFGGCFPPSAFLDRRLGLHVGHVAPQPFCACFRDLHSCDKRIPKERLLGELRVFMERNPRLASFSMRIR